MQVLSPPVDAYFRLRLLRQRKSRAQEIFSIFSAPKFWLFGMCIKFSPCFDDYLPNFLYFCK